MVQKCSAFYFRFDLTCNAAHFTACAEKECLGTGHVFMAQLGGSSQLLSQDPRNRVLSA